MCNFVLYVSFITWTFIVISDMSVSNKFKLLKLLSCTLKLYFLKQVLKIEVLQFIGRVTVRGYLVLWTLVKLLPGLIPC